ncbi:hypothetical protein DCS_03222 [Drechmeria coniospora]|uniref:Uncharacterized protein n=1 Tax=Drechmeria coniospora TaxID=98403 RepID=A0A151GYA8_DRECN|nr:hypothetical protein DCS_03222 [Drechmeria coniospora]KYK62077.1 hypothetical protein DCS_03222 [Drechmeria coniospora]
MDRMIYVPGPQAKEQIFQAQGHMFFSRQTALDFADEFVRKAPGGCTGPHLPQLYERMRTCLGEGEQVDIWFGLCRPDTTAGQEELSSGELVGHTWALHRTADGEEKHLWEVGRGTPAMGEAFAARAFNAYREAMARFLGKGPPPAVLVDQTGMAAERPREFKRKPIISRALSPSNLYHASGRMWYFVELAPPPTTVDEPVVLSRPMRSFDALALSALAALAWGEPPLVFGISSTTDMLGKLPTGFVRTTYEADETVKRRDGEILLVI